MDVLLFPSSISWCEQWDTLGVCYGGVFTEWQSFQYLEGETTTLYPITKMHPLGMVGNCPVTLRKFFLHIIVLSDSLNWGMERISLKDKSLLFPKDQDAICLTLTLFFICREGSQCINVCIKHRWDPQWTRTISKTQHSEESCGLNWGLGT